MPNIVSNLVGVEIINPKCFFLFRKWKENMNLERKRRCFFFFFLNELTRD